MFKAYHEQNVVFNAWEEPNTSKKRSIYESLPLRSLTEIKGI